MTDEVVRLRAALVAKDARIAELEAEAHSREQLIPAMEKCIAALEAERDKFAQYYAKEGHKALILSEHISEIKAKRRELEAELAKRRSGELIDLECIECDWTGSPETADDDSHKWLVCPECGTTVMPRGWLQYTDSEEC